jgi:hypothetical protein
MRIIVLAVLTIMLTVSVSYAAHPLITDDAGTMGAKAAQAEINTEISYDEGSINNVVIKEIKQEISAIMTYGISDELDLVVGIPYQWIIVKEDGDKALDVNGLADISLELKLKFFEEGDLSMAFKPGITLPTGDENDGLGNGRASYSLTFISTKEISDMALHLNVAYMRNEYELEAEANRKDIWHVSLAAETEVTNDLVAVANIGAERNPDKASNTHPTFILGGVVYSIDDRLDIDLGVKAGLNSPETDFALLAGIVLKL